MRCGEKTRFASHKRAAKVRDRVNQKGVAVPLSTYQCPVCRGWHLTSHPRSAA